MVNLDNAGARSGRPLRVLIVRIGAMGDILHAMPAVAALRKLHPDWEIGWAIEPGWSELMVAGSALGVGQAGSKGGLSRGTTMPLVDRLHPVATKAWQRKPFAIATISQVIEARRQLRDQEYDVCVDMQGALKSAVVGRLAGAGMFAGPKNPREAQARWFYEEHVVRNAAHVVEQGCELLGGAIGEVLCPAKVELPVDGEAERWCDELLARMTPGGEPFVFIAPTAGWGAKEWPAERYGGVAAALGRAGYRSIVNATHRSNAMADVVVRESGGAAVAVPSSMSEMTALIRRAGLAIGGDTGPIHLAAAMERPIVAIYGPTDPARTGPYGIGKAIDGWVLRDVSSVTDHSRRTAPEAGMLRIRVEDVVAVALNLLAEADSERLEESSG